MDTAHQRAMAIAEATLLSQLLRAARRGESMDGTGNLVTALLDAARALRRSGIPYAVIGGFAVGMYAVPRATANVNLTVPTPERERAATELADARFTLRGTYPHSATFRHANGSPVQLAFDELLDPMIERAEVVEVDDSPRRGLVSGLRDR